MDTLTPTELLAPSEETPEISENPADTPKSVERGRRGAKTLTWTLATTQVMFAPMITSYDISSASEATAVIEEEEGFEDFAPIQPAEESSPWQTARESEADAANRARLELLARQYVSKQLSTEEEARLAIVSERVRRLIPRVTEEDFQALERILEDAERIESEDSERRYRLGID